MGIFFSLWSLLLIFTDLKYHNSSEYFPLYSILYLYGGITGLVFLRDKCHWSNLSLSLRYLSYSLISFSAGLVVQTVIFLYTNTEKYPSIADWIFLFFVFYLTLSAYYALLIFIPRINSRNILSIILLLASFTFIGIKIHGLPEFTWNLANLDSSIFDLLYYLFNTLNILLIMLLLTFAGGKIFKGLMFFIAGLIFQGIGDYLFTYRLEEGTFFVGGYTDLAFVLSGLFLSLSILYNLKVYDMNSSK